LRPANCRIGRTSTIAYSCRPDLRDDLDGFIQVLGLDEIKPGQLFLGSGEGAIGDGDLTLRICTAVAVGTASEATSGRS